jgi:glycosyltransferase involved in cell wall biosynthesis
MKILFIAPRFPYPPLSGDQVRGYSQLKLLAYKHEVTLLTREPNGDREGAIRKVEEVCERVVTVKKPPTMSGATRVARLAMARMPIQTALECDPSFARAAFVISRDSQFDLAHVQLARLGPVAASLPPGLPKVLDLIDALSVNMKRRAARTSGPFSWAAQWEGKQMARYEKALHSSFDEVVIASPADRAAIGDLANLSVVPNAIDLDVHRFVSAPREPNMIAFTGTMFYFPNVDAALWFSRDILPLVRRAIPEARTFVVGARPIRAIRSLDGQSGITITGRVTSVHEYIGRAGVAVAPMRSGSGTQFKVLEAMAAGTPVVGTPLAFAGLDVVDGRDALVASDPPEFARKVVQVLRKPEEFSQLTRNARRLVETKYSVECTLKLLEAAYDRAIARHAPRFAAV